MKVLVCSLQVGKNSSLGHFHPALEIARAFKSEGHQVGLLPLPSELDEGEVALLKSLSIDYLMPPPLPLGVLFNQEELGEKASDEESVAKIYQSFLVDPIPWQKDLVIEQIKEYSPTVIVFDLLVYLAKIAALELNISEIGFCAGLKLIAPHPYQTFYADVARKISSLRMQCLAPYYSRLKFKHLEVLAKDANLVFAPEKLVGKHHDEENNIRCVGPLHPGEHRFQQTIVYPKKFGIVSFGSVLDPADYPTIVLALQEVSRDLGFLIYVVSKKMVTMKDLSPFLHVVPYLPLSHAMQQNAEFIIHHGGANTFSETLLYGAKQILIPLTTDQPIQAHYLQEAQAGFFLRPGEVSAHALLALIRRLQNENDTVHRNRLALQKLYQNENGAKKVVEIAAGLAS